MDELLTEVTVERRFANLSLPGTSSSLPPRILTKEEDCLRLFRATGVPHPGALWWGVYRWAAGLGEARFNFDTELGDDNYRLLDAYD